MNPVIPPDILQMPFHWGAFLFACFIGCLPEGFGFFTAVMKKVIRRIVINTVNNSMKYRVDDDQINRVTTTQIDEFIEKKFAIEDPAGKIIGVIERFLYTYALFSQETVIIGGILTFKAFGGWVSSYDRETIPDLAESKDKPHYNDTVLILLSKNKELNAIYLYSYAIGNFMSLLISVLSFEIVKYWIQHPIDIKSVLNMS